MSTTTTKYRGNGIVTDFNLTYSMLLPTVKVYVENILIADTEYSIIDEEFVRFNVAPINNSIIKITADTEELTNVQDVNIISDITITDPVDINVINDSNAMLKSEYDINLNGIVDNSEALGGNVPSYFLNRANHNGTIDIADITDLENELEKRAYITGFDNIENIQITVNDATRQLTIAPIVGQMEIHCADGSRYFLGSQTITWSDVEGLIYIYFDNNGVLQEFINPNRKIQYEKMISTLPVSYIEWDFVNKTTAFATDILKGREMALTTWVKNFYDLDIYNLQGLNTLGGLGGDGSLDIHSQIGFTTGDIIFTDRKYYVPTRNIGDNWSVLYLSGINLRRKIKTSFPVLQDTDFALTTTGRIVYNNNGIPTAVNSGNYVWYFFGINNNIDDSQRLVSFMGQTQYSTENLAIDSVNDEINIVEESFSIKQEFALVYAVLYETKNSFSNSTLSTIINVKAIKGSTGTTAAASIPDELIDGSETILHNHPISAITDLGTQLSDINTSITDIQASETTIGWNDLLGNFHVGLKGASAPISTIVSNGSTWLKFNNGDSLIIDYHTLHDGVVGSEAFIHIHMFSDTDIAIGETIEWTAYFVSARGYSQGDNLLAPRTTIIFTFTADKIITAGDPIILEQLTSTFNILEPDSTIQIEWKKTGGTYLGNVFGIQADIHYQTVKDNTTNRNFPFE